MPLSTSLSHALIAFTIELDNEFERRLGESGHAPRVTSWVMWANFMRFVGDGIMVGELPAAAGIPKARTLSTLGGMERWRYVYVGDDPEAKRDGYGSARGLRAESVVRLTPAGRAAEAIWRPLPGEIEGRWRERFGAGAVDELRLSLEENVERLDVGLPEFMPIVGGASWKAADAITPGERDPAAPAPLSLSALLSRAVLAYTLEYERRAELPLPLSANVARVLHESAVGVKDLPLHVGMPKEGVAMALTFLTKTGFVAVEDKVARLTPAGRDAQAAASRLHAETEAARSVSRLTAALGAILEQRDLLARGLQPPSGGWRGTKRYLAHTEAMLADPTAALPHHPMVLHRGGWPDGS